MVDDLTIASLEAQIEGLRIQNEKLCDRIRQLEYELDLMEPKTYVKWKGRRGEQDG